jgi:hypothetical protein
MYVCTDATEDGGDDDDDDDDDDDEARVGSGERATDGRTDGWTLR